MVKIAAFDFDGTIYFPDGLDPEAAEAIREWQAAGHLAVTATGKSKEAADEALEGTGLRVDYEVLSTGACVLDRGGNIVEKHLLSSAQTEHVIAHFVGMPGVDVYAVTLSGLDVCFHKGWDGPQTKILPRFITADLSELASFEITALGIWIPDNPELQAAAAEWVTANTDQICLRNASFVDLIPASAEKGSAIVRLIERLGFAREEVELFTFGDGNNDLSMHAVADRSFTFPWASDHVKAQCTDVVPSAAAGLRLCF